MTTMTMDSTPTTTPTLRTAYDFLRELRAENQRKSEWLTELERLGDPELFTTIEDFALTRARAEADELRAAALSICPTIAQVRADFEDDAASRARISEIADAGHPFIDGVRFDEDGKATIMISTEADGIGSFEISDLVEEITRITLDVAGHAPAQVTIQTSGSHWLFDTEFETLDDRPATEVLDEYLGD